MTKEKLKIDYKIFMEAEDVAQSRIISTESYVKKSLAAHKNPYTPKYSPLFNIL